MLVATLLLVLFSLTNCHELSETELKEKFDELKEKFLDENGDPVLLKRHLGATLALTLRSNVSTEERYEIFAEESDFIEKHNKEANKEWTAGYNEFTILSKDEKSHFLGLNTSTLDDMANMMKFNKRSVRSREKVALLRRSSNDSDFEVSYADKLPDAKNQGTCGSCYIFSGIASIEYQVNKNSDTVTSLSEQHALDCARSNPDTDDGCNGGSVTTAITWLKDEDSGNGFVSTNEEYPYVYVGGDCPNSTDEYTNGFEGFTVWGVRYLSGTDDDLSTAMDDPEIGAVIVTIAVVDDFYSYESGIYYEDDCTTVNHGVVVIGYGIEGGIPYFLVRNSWGTSWGISGNVKMKRGSDGTNLNTCELSGWLAYPLIYQDVYAGDISWCSYEGSYIYGSTVYYEDTKSSFSTLDAAKKGCVMTEDCTGFYYYSTSGTYNLVNGMYLVAQDSCTAYTLCGGWTERTAQLEGETTTATPTEKPTPAEESSDSEESSDTEESSDSNSNSKGNGKQRQRGKK